MTVSKPSQDQINTYAKLCHYLNKNNGNFDANSAIYYKFLDDNRVEHSTVLKSVQLCSRLYARPTPFVLHVDGRTAKCSGGSFYLTSTGNDIVKGLNINTLPVIAVEPELEDEIDLSYLSIMTKKAKTGVRQEENWTKEEVVNLLTTQAHLVGRMLGTGYDLLEPMHGEWISEWLLNPKGLGVLIHQAHRSSYKSCCLRLACAITVILQPLQTLLIIRKSEDAVKELMNGVSKILDTPLFHKFVEILHPDVIKKGGFKKTTDTALAVDTNLNVSLSGEYQIRALGLGSPFTGKHAGKIITDDICTTSDRESDAERRATILKYQELMNLLSHNKGFSNTMILNIGTPWHEEDVFQLMEKGLKDRTKEQEELEDIPAKNRTEEQSERIRQLNMLRGKFVYNCYQTGLMTDKDVEWKKKTLNDDVLFSANYLLSLVSDDEKPFPKINNVGNYNNSFFADAWEVVAAIDAAYQGVDTCALGVGAYNWETSQTIVYGKLYEIALDENYMELAEEMFNCGVQKLFMETNTDKGLMGAKFREIGFTVEGYHESQNKHTKIVSTIRPFWREAGHEILPCVQFTAETDPAYLAQIHGYKKGVKKDDAPDNLACLLLKSKFGGVPIRIT